MKLLTLIGSSDPRGTSVKINTILTDKLGQLYPDAEIITRQAFPTTIRPCTNCGACKRKGKCTLRDEFDVWKEDLMTADMTFFVFPVYYYGIPAQFKAFLDRFHSCAEELQKAGIRIAPIIISAESAEGDPHCIDSIVLQLRQISAYENFDLQHELWLGGLLRAGNINDDTIASLDAWLDTIRL